MKNLLFLLILFCVYSVSCTVDLNETQKIITIKQSASPQGVKKKLENLAFYNGFLSSLNSPTLLRQPTMIANFLNQYDLIVIGVGLESNIHNDYANTKLILDQVNTSLKVFGSISLGSTPKAESIYFIKLRIDNWVKLKVEGIFINQAGFEHWDSTDLEMRTCQNEILNYIHSKGLIAMINVWEPDDLFTKISSQPTTILANDYVLYESYLFSSGQTLPLAGHRNKLKKLMLAEIFLYLHV